MIHSYSTLSHNLPPLELPTDCTIRLPPHSHTIFSSNCLHKDSGRWHFVELKDSCWDTCVYCNMKIELTKLRSVKEFRVAGKLFKIGEVGLKGFLDTAKNKVIKEIGDCEYADLAQAVGVSLNTYRVKLEENSKDDPVILAGCDTCPKTVYSFRRIRQNLPPSQCKCEEPTLMIRFKRVSIEDLPKHDYYAGELDLPSYGRVKAMLDNSKEIVREIRAGAVMACRRLTDEFKEARWTALR